jgi:hypothetical protein
MAGSFLKNAVRDRRRLVAAVLRFILGACQPNPLQRTTPSDAGLARLAGLADIHVGNGPILPHMSDIQTTVVFACPACGTIYQASQRRGPGTHFGVFNCIACHTEVHAWNGLYDFLDWQVGFSLRAGDADAALRKKS